MWVLSLIGFLVAVGFGVVVPVLPVFARSFGVSNAAVGVVVASFAAVRLIVQPFCGAINQAIGERTALAIGMVIVAASSAACGLATSYPQLLAMRAAGGVGSAMFTVAAITLLLRAANPSQRGRASALYSGGFLIGGMAGPAIGGLFSGISLQAPFFFYAGTLLLAGLAGITLLSSRQPVTKQSADHRSAVGLRQAWTDARYRAACLANFASGWQSIGVRGALIPVLVTEQLGRSPGFSGFAFAVAAVVQGLFLTPVGRAVDRPGGRRRFLVLGGLICAAAALALGFSPNPWWLVAALCVYGAGASMLSTAPTALVGDALGQARSTPVAIFQMTADLGSILGPILAGMVADRLSLPVAFALGALLLALSAGYGLVVPKESLAPKEPR